MQRPIDAAASTGPAIGPAAGGTASICVTGAGIGSASASTGGADSNASASGTVTCISANQSRSANVKDSMRLIAARANVRKPGVDGHFVNPNSRRPE
jgi:hypothetical protein